MYLTLLLSAVILSIVSSQDTTQDWSTYSGSVHRVGINPSEISIKSSNINTVKVKWSLPIEGTVVAQPVVVIQYNINYDPFAKFSRKLSTSAENEFGQPAELPTYMPSSWTPVLEPTSNPTRNIPTVKPTSEKRSHRPTVYPQTVRPSRRKYPHTVQPSQPTCVPSIRPSTPSIQPVTSRPSKRPTNLGYDYLGCYADNAVRAMYSNVGNAKSVDECYRKSIGYKYFGIQYGGECWVSNSLSDSSQYGECGKPGCTGANPACTCTMKCQNGIDNCGGGFSFVLYEVLKSLNPPTVTPSTSSPTATLKPITGPILKNVGYIGDSFGNFYAFDTAKGKLLWKRGDLGYYHSALCYDLPNGNFGITGTATFDRSINTIYVAGGVGTIWALNMKNGETLWSVPNAFDYTELTSYGALLLYDHVIYITLGARCDISTSAGGFYGGILAVSTLTKSIVNVFKPSGKGPGGGIWGLGGLTLGAIEKNANTPIFFNTGNCMQQQDGEYCEQVVKITSGSMNVTGTYLPVPNPSPMQTDNDFGSSTTYFNSRDEKQLSGCKAPLLSSTRKDGVLYIVNADTMQVIQIFQISDPLGAHLITQAAWDPISGILVQPTDVGYGPVKYGLIGYKLNPDCTLSRIWNANMNSPSTPIIVGPPGDRVAVMGGAFCFFAVDVLTGKIVTLKGINSFSVAAPTITNGTILVSGFQPGSITAFALS